MSKQKNKEEQQAPRRAILYNRVSGDEQENNTSLKTQEDDGREYAKANGIEVVAVVNEVHTGIELWERKEFMRVLKMLEDGFANMLIVRTFDRLSRNYEHFAIISEKLRRYHVEIEVAKEHVDKSPMGWVARVIMQVLATLEHGKIIDRTTTGKRNTVLQKKKIPSSWKPRYGYRYDNSEKGMRKCFLIKNEEADVVRSIHMRYDAGIPVSSIVRELIAQDIKPPYKAWTRTAVLRILRYRPYTGKGQFFAEHMYNTKYPMEPVDIPEGLVPQIIDEELFERNQKRLAINQQEAPRNNEHPEEFLLRSGHICCAECGRRMHGKRRLRGKNKQSISLAYVCTAHSDLNTVSRPCTGQRINAKEVDTLVWEYVELFSYDSEDVVLRLRQAIEHSDFREYVIAVQNTIEAWGQRSELYKQDLQNPYLKGPARDSVLRDLTVAEQTIENLKIELQKLKAHEVDELVLKKQYENLLQWFERVQANDEMPYAMRRDLLRFLGLKVYIRKVARQQKEQTAWLEVQLELPEFANAALPAIPHMRNLNAGQLHTIKELRRMIHLVEDEGQNFTEEELDVIIEAYIPNILDATQEEMETVRRLIASATYATEEKRKEMLAAVENARRTAGTDTENGDIATRALRAQFGTA